MNYIGYKYNIGQLKLYIARVRRHGETKLTVPSVVGKDSQYYFLTPNSPTLATEGRLRMFLFSKMSQGMSAVSLLHFQIALGDSNDLQRFSKLLGCTVVVPL